MRRALSSCRLYSWMRLTWQSKMRVGIDRLAGRCLQPVGEAATLASRLALRNGSRKPLSSASGFSLRELAEVGDPAVADGLGDRAGERRVRQQQPAPRRDAVGLVVEPLGEHLGQVLDRRLAQQLGVDRGDAVGAVRADDRQVGHADLALAAPSSIRLIRSMRPSSPGKRCAHVVEEAAVDLVDDLQVARQQHLEPAQRPFFQRLGQQRVVGVGQGSLREVPGLVPAELASSSRMRISSGTASAGWVSLSWMATLSGSAFQSVLPRRKRRTRSASEQATRKYSCTKRSPWPMLVESSG